MKLTVDGVDINDMPKFDAKPAKIDAWYDRHTRDYCIQILNKDGYEVRDCIRVGDKVSRDAVVRDLKEEYGI